MTDSIPQGASLASLLALLTREHGHQVTMTYEPVDGYRAVVDVCGEDDTVTVHEGIAPTPAAALQAAAHGAGLAPDPAGEAAGPETLERRIGELEARLDEDTRHLIHALADAVKMLRSRDEADEAAPAVQP